MTQVVSAEQYECESGIHVRGKDDKQSSLSKRRHFEYLNKPAAILFIVLDLQHDLGELGMCCTIFGIVQITV